MTSRPDDASPLVSVIMSVFNGEPHLRQALDSLIGQTLRDLEIIVVDDGSRDGSGAILADYARRDARVRVIRNQRNLGLTRSLNLALAAARGEFVARLDSDDLSRPDRLAVQAAFLDQHPRVGVCGSWVTLREEPSGDERVVSFPREPALLRCRLLFDNVIAHPSVMFRRRLLREHGLAYDEHFRCSQDYDLWVRCAEKMELANVPLPLVVLRQHAGQITRNASGAQAETAREVRRRQLQSLGIAATEEQLALHCRIADGKPIPTLAYLAQVDQWLRTLWQHNERSRWLPPPALKRVLAELWRATAFACASDGLRCWLTYVRSPLADVLGLATLELLARCLASRGSR